MTRSALTAVLFIALLASPAAACDEEQPCYKDEKLPELKAENGQWFNAEEPPRFADLKGRHVLVVLTTLW